MKVVNILGVPVAAINLIQAVAEIKKCIVNNQNVYITVTGIHGIMESQYDRKIKIIHQHAAMCVPDGMPTVWIGKVRGHKSMSRVYGPDLMANMIKVAHEEGYTNFFYGGKKGVPELLKEWFLARYKGLKIVGFYSPPFRSLNEKEENELHELFERVCPDITWVGLSTPKQEEWMSTHLGKLNTRVMIGVGAAFDFHAGILKQAPRWMQKCGLEWLFRLGVEPKRLWKRYLKNNPLFLWNFALQILKIKNFD